MVLLLRCISGSKPQLRLFITRSFHHKRVLCLPSYYRVNKSVCHGSPYPPIYLEAPIQENKRVEPIEVPKLNIDDVKLETSVPKTDKLTSSEPDNRLPVEQPDENKVNKQLAKPSLWARVKKEIIHYYHGFRLLGLEVRIASGICFRVLRGHTLTRRERKQLVRTVADIIRLVPFAVFIIVPFMELLLPFYLKFFPFMLPSTFKEKSSEANAIQQRLKAKLELTRFLQETMLQTTGASKGDPDTPSVVEFQDFIKQLQKSGQQAQAKDITRFSKLFEDQVTLESLDNKQLRMLCQLLSLPTMGPSHLLRFQIWMRVRQLKAEDRLIAKEGVDKIPPWELQTLCQERGMRSVGLPKERLQSQLVEWLDLHLKQNVPLTLLLFSRALHVSQATIDQNPLQQAIAQLPASASSEVVARVLENTPHDALDPKTKIQVLREEQDSIKAAREQRKQELAEKEKAEAEQAKVSSAAVLEELTDQAPLLKGLKHEELDKVTPVVVDPATILSQTAGVQPKSKEPAAEMKPPADMGHPAHLKDGVCLSCSTDEQKTLEPAKAEDVTEITAGDLAEIRSAIEISTSELHEETIHDLKEKVAETAKLQQQHHAEFTTAEQVSDKRKSKAAVHLESRVERLIKEMDTMVDKLDDKRQKLLRDIEIRANHIKDSIEEEEQSKMIDAIKADHQRVVDMNDLLESLKRIQSVHDHKRWEKILKVLDEDKDGKIELKHILSVIELLGEGNVKVSSKEITRILEMIDNEELANAISLESELKADKSSSSASVENSTQVPLKQKNNNNKDDSERSKREDN